MSQKAPDTRNEDWISLVLQKLYPKSLAERIVQHGGSLQCERRYVPVVFAGMSGFTAWAEKSEPEEVPSERTRMVDVPVIGSRESSSAETSTSRSRSRRSGSQ